MAKVLLVEDDNNLREIYEARLQAEGYDTATASDGEQALVVAKEAKPDLVISDVMMPKISGFEMLDILRNTDGLKDVKVIMLTALGQAEDKARADQLGADRYLVKSQVTLEDIVKTAHQLLDEVATPAPAGAPATVSPVDPASAAAGASAADPATTDEETQVMQQQIETFAAQPVADSSAPATPAEPVAEPATPAAPVATPAEPVAVQTAAPVSDDAVTTAHDDQVMATAVDSLASAADAQRPSEVTAVEVAPVEPVPEASAPVSTPTPPTPETPAPETPAPVIASDDTTPSHKKVIKPLDDDADAKPDINELLAAEEAAEIASQTAALAGGSSATPVEPVPAPAPDPALQLSPELEAAIVETDATTPMPPPAEPSNPVNITEPPADPNQPNPNDISL